METSHIIIITCSADDSKVFAIPFRERTASGRTQKVFVETSHIIIIANSADDSKVFVATVSPTHAALFYMKTIFFLKKRKKEKA